MSAVFYQRFVLIKVEIMETKTAIAISELSQSIRSFGLQMQQLSAAICPLSDELNHLAPRLRRAFYMGRRKKVVRKKQYRGRRSK